MKNTVFTGAGVAIVTPMHEDGSIHYEKLKIGRASCRERV